MININWQSRSFYVASVKEMDAGRRLARILILTEIFRPCPQAPSQRVSSFAKSLSLSGCRVSVIAANRCFREKLGSPIYDGLQVYNLRCPRAILSLSSLMLDPFITLLFLLFSVVVGLKDGIDAILVSVPNGDVGVAGFFASKLLAVPLLVDMRDLYPPSSSTLPYLHASISEGLNKLLTVFFSFIYRNIEKISCVDSSIKKKLENLGICSASVVVIPNGADLSIYKPCFTSRKREKIRQNYRLPLDKLIIVYAGSLARYYPLRTVIEGLKAMSSDRDNIQFLVVALRGHRDLETFVRRLGLKDAVKFMGPLRVEEASTVLSACDVGVVVYRAESVWKGTFGSKIFSYMACGLPILASGPRGSVIGQLISQNNVGVFVGEPTQSNFARQFSFVLNNREEIKKMGENARRLVERSYDRKRISLRLASVMESMVSRDG